VILSSEPKIAFTASQVPNAQDALRTLIEQYGQCEPAQAEVICALGGDGFMLGTLHRYGILGIPVFGMKLGSVGFLMNQFDADGLIERLKKAERSVIHPLEMTAQTESGMEYKFIAYNEVSLLRQTRQAAQIEVSLNEQIRLEELVCDGILVSTPAGSTAYNFSAMGPILPLGSSVIALTPIAPFRPRRWRGAILRADTRIKLRVLDPYKRPVSVTADSHEVRDVVEVVINEDKQNSVTLLFDPEHSLDDRILNEQFTT
jgi:NAD+ kinase